MISPVVNAITGIGSLLASSPVLEIELTTWSEVERWFDEQTDYIEQNIDLTSEERQLLEEKLRGFIFVEEQDEGVFRIIQGVFNKDTGEILDGRKVSSSEIDEKLLKVFETKRPKLVLI